MKRFCKHPFRSIQVQNTGDIYCCCCFWTDFYSFGNIFEQSFDEIWNGAKARKFRQQFIDDKYDICHTEFCDPYLCEFEPSNTADYPEYVEFSYDRKCNVRCIFCREKPTPEEYNADREKEKRIEENFEKIFTPVIEKAKFIGINSAGELFAGTHSLELVKKIVKINANIKFDIISNGILMTKEKIDEYKLKDKLNSVVISIHAAQKSTYDKIVLGGNFDKVIKNVEYLSSLKNEGLLNVLQLNFTVTSLNFREAVEFARFAKRMNARAFFIEYHEQIKSQQLKDELDVTVRTHPLYSELYNVFANPIFKEDFCSVSRNLSELEPPPKKSFMEKVIQKVQRLFIR